MREVTLVSQVAMQPGSRRAPTRARAERPKPRREPLRVDDGRRPDEERTMGETGSPRTIAFQFGCKVKSEIVAQHAAGHTRRDTYQLQRVEEPLPQSGTREPEIVCEACSKRVPITLYADDAIGARMTASKLKSLLFAGVGVVVFVWLWTQSDVPLAVYILPVLLVAGGLVMLVQSFAGGVGWHVRLPFFDEHELVADSCELREPD